MYVYTIFTILVGYCLWSLLRLVRYYKGIQQWTSKVPQMIPNHWFWGFTNQAKDFDGLMALGQKYVDKFGPKWFHSWNAILYANLVLVHPDSMKAFMTRNNVPKNRGFAGAYRMLLPWIGDGLLASNDAKWERNRRLLTPALHFNILKPYVAVYHDVADILLRKLESYGGKSINICPLISRATLDTMLRCTLSYKSETVQSEERDEHPYVHAVAKLKYFVLKRVINPLLYLEFLYSLTADYKEFWKCCDFVHDFSSNIIQSRRKSLEKDPSQTEKRYLDFLDILLTAKDEKGEGLTHQEIRDEVDTFMFAGHDTTASAIMWVLFSLGKYPEMQQKVREDIEEVLQGRERLEYDDFHNLGYTTCFIKESLRMYTPVPAISRQLLEPAVVDGIDFPAGTVVDINPHLMHHNPSVWEDHMKFDPERFTEENITKKDSFAFLPFSAGQRNCIGQKFAMGEIKTVISRIVTSQTCLKQPLKRDKSKVFTTNGSLMKVITIDDTWEPTPYKEIVMSAKDGIYLHFRDL